MEKDLKKDVEKNNESKMNENRKFHVVLLVTILILLFVLAFVIKLANDKKQEIISVVDNNDIVVNNEEIKKETTSSNELISNTDDVESDAENKYKNYKPFTKVVVDNKKNNEYIELIEIIDNKDNTATLNFRKYKEVDIPELTEEQYNELIKNNEIEILNDTYTYNPRAKILTNNKYVSFELDEENKKLSSYPLTVLCEGTDEYYTITCSTDLSVYDLPENTSIKILDYFKNKSLVGDFDYLSLGYLIESYEFNEKNELIKIEQSY